MRCGNTRGFKSHSVHFLFLLLSGSVHNITRLYYSFYMDIFQLFGDFLHLMAVLLLVLKILANRNVVGNSILINAGLSYKTQEIYLVVFVTRYIDLLLGWKSLYIFIMKILFISITAYTMYLMRYKKPFCLSYDRDSDSFPHYYVYLAALLMAVIIHKSFNPLDFTWSFSIWL